MNSEQLRNSPITEYRPSDVKRFLFLVTEYYYFRSHKKAVASMAVEAGFNVFVAAKPDTSIQPPVGFKVKALNWQRSNSLLAATLQFFPELLRVRRLLRDVKPHILHNIALKPVVIGSLAAIGSKTRVVNSINGFGFVFYNQSMFAKIVQKICATVLRLSVRMNDAYIVLQNKDDVRFVQHNIGIPETNIRLIAGSGVDTTEFVPQPEPKAGPFKFLILARLLYIKGIQIAVAAHSSLRAQGVLSELVICGGQDEDNPSSISTEKIAEWSKIPGVTFTGYVTDVRPLIAQSHVVLHPALGGEGLPKALLEAAASAKAMIASDIRGSREIVRPNETGLLVPPGNAAALADAMRWIIDHPSERALWAETARAKVIAEFALTIVLNQHSELYREFEAVHS
ncbi:MAG: hypothetical protein CMG46_10400 [Candidatus Marinimicrobia bacterium]|nr:hypothetical protein [Candidatus Neomarinimicrobiota bacterium]